MDTRNRVDNLFKHIDFIIFDFILLEAAFYIATLIYGKNNYLLIRIGSAAFRRQQIALAASLAVSLAVEEPYKDILKRTKWMELGRMITHTMFLALLDVVILFFIHDIGITSRMVTGYMWLIYFISFLGVRLVWKKVIRNYVTHHKAANRQVVICTVKAEMESLVDGILAKDFLDYDIPAIFLSDYDPKQGDLKEYAGIPVAGNTDDMMDYVTHNWTDEVVLYLPGRVTESNELISRLDTAGIEVRNVVLNLYGMNDSASAYVEKMGSLVVISQQSREIPLREWIAKKLLDILGGIVGCLLTVIIFIFVAPAIYIKSPGPIFFKQDRVGRNGKVFKMYKFRSMYMDAEERKQELMKQNKIADGMMFKMEDDPRIIGSEKKDRNGKPKGIGNFIRRTSLDEFPQFFNVLKGDMSLVGTRPPTLDEWSKYSEHHRKRLSMRPGITGLWQVSGRSEITDFEKVVELDSRYIDNWTVALDIKILIRTVARVLKREGAE